MSENMLENNCVLNVNFNGTFVSKESAIPPEILCGITDQVLYDYNTIIV